MLDVVSLVCQRSPGSPLIENGNLTISEDALNDVLTAVKRVRTTFCVNFKAAVLFKAGLLFFHIGGTTDP